MSSYAANARKPFLAVSGVPIITIGKAAYGTNPTYAAIGLRCVACKSAADRARAGALPCPPLPRSPSQPDRISGVVSDQPGLLAALGGALLGGAWLMFAGHRRAW